MFAAKALLELAHKKFPLNEKQSHSITIKNGKLCLTVLIGDKFQMFFLDDNDLVNYPTEIWSQIEQLIQAQTFNLPARRLDYSNVDEKESFADNAKVKLNLIGPSWLGLMRILVFIDHQSGKYFTVWYMKYVSRIFGTYTPPRWFLKLIGH